MKLIWSHTFLDTFERCPKQFFHRFVAKDLSPGDSEAMRWGNLVHSAMENRLNEKQQPLPAEMTQFEKFATPFLGKTLWVEKKLGVGASGRWTGFFAEDTVGRGKLDVVLFKDDKALIVDWKTGKKREDPSELEVFSVLLRAAVPTLKTIKGLYVWLKEGSIGQQHELDPKRKAEEIKRTMERVEQHAAKDSWPPFENPLCGWCAVKECVFKKDR